VSKKLIIGSKIEKEQQLLRGGDQVNIKNNTRHPVYFIVEMGQNHQGDIRIAKEIVDSLSDLPVSCVKTAKRDIDTCLTEKQKSMPYLNPNSFGKTYYEHRKALELSKDDFVELKNYVEGAGFDFLSSFTDLNSLLFLMEINVKGLKIASSRLADIALLKAVSAIDLPVIVSTGMSSIEDVDRAIDILKGNEKYLLQCTSVYPCPGNELNLNTISMYKERYKDRIDGVGFSGHHWGIAPDIAAYMLGATILERHYTLERGMKGTNHAASLEKKGIQYILNYISQIEEALGTDTKKVLESEIPAMERLRADL